MSPRWGFKTFGHPVCYKHVAPLGLKTSGSHPLKLLSPDASLETQGCTGLKTATTVNKPT